MKLEVNLEKKTTQVNVWMVLGVVFFLLGATAVASVMLGISFVLLLVINGLQTWQRKRSGASS